MADIDLKTETPDASLPADGFLFGADSQAAASPSVYTTQSVATRLLGSTTLSGTTITANAPVLDLAQTWNNAAVTFTGAKFNVTDTASNAASLLMDLQVGGASRFKVAKTGTITVGAGTSTPGAQGITFVGETAAGIYAGSSQLYFTANAFNFLQQVRVTGQLSVESNSNNLQFGTSFDVIVGRRGAANLRLGAADAAGSATVTITIATPGVVTWNSHGLSTGTPVIFSTTGALPTGITAGTTYYVIAVDTNTFRIATSLANALAGTAVNTSGSQSGTHTGQRGAIDQMLSVQSVVAGTTNFPGADFVISGSQGTGTGAGGSIVFQVAPAGSSGTAQNALATALTIVSAPPSGSVTSASVALQIGAHGYISAPFGNGIELNCANANGYWVALNGHTGTFIGNNVPLGWSSTKSQTGVDLTLYRDAANTLALRNGTNAQTFHVYNTFTASDNFERLRIVAQSGGSVIIGTQKGTAGGTARALELQTDGTTRLTISATSNTITLPAGSSFNSGASGVVSLRYINDPTNAISFFDFYNTAGLATFSIGATNPRMNFGGTTSSYPALKRSSTSLIVRLADDSANAPLESASVKTDAPAGGTSGTWKLGVAATVSPTSPNRTIEVDIGGTIYYLHAKTTND